MTTPRPSSPLRYALRHPAVRAGVVASALAAALTLVVAGTAWPVWREQAGLADALADKRRQLVQRQQAEALARAAAAARADVAAVERKLSQVSSQSVVVDHLVRLAREHRLHIVSQAYEERRSREQAPTLLVELVVQGGYAPLRGFLDALPSLPVLHEVEEASLQAQVEPGVVRGRLRIALYRQAASKEAP